MTKIACTILTSTVKICSGVPKREQHCFRSAISDIGTSLADLGSANVEVKGTLSLFFLLHVLAPQVLQNKA
jgi:hypothetical protein